MSRVCAVILLVACSWSLACSRSGSRTSPRVVVVITVDWEGAYFSPEGMAALEELRTRVGGAPFTHFVSAAYFTKDPPDPTASRQLAGAIRAGDELAVHLHVWKSLARASGIAAPKVSPSFLNGTDKILELEDGDTGIDTDLDVYDVPELRLLLRTSRRLIAQTGVTVSTSFSAGANLGTPKVLQAARAEGYMVDASAIDPRHGEDVEAFQRERLAELWPKVEPLTQPFTITTPHGPLLEMPVAVLVDETTTDKLVKLIEAAHQKLVAQPDRDVFVVIGLTQETAADAPKVLGTAIERVRTRPELARDLTFTTIANAAARVPKAAL